MSALKPSPPGESALACAAAHGAQAAAVGFDWPEAAGVMEKVREELRELEEALADSGGRADAAVRHELGDLVLALTSLARALDVDLEDTLRRADERFVQRFHEVEAIADQRGLELSALDPAGLDGLWREAKTRLAAPSRAPRGE